MKRKSDTKTEPDFKKQKVAGKCKLGCSRSVNPGTTQKGNPFDTCCRRCVESRKRKDKNIIHDVECDERYYEELVLIGKINKLENWNDVNNRIKLIWKQSNEYNTIKDYLLKPLDNNHNISSIIIDYCSPKLIPLKPYWKPNVVKQKSGVFCSKISGRPYIKIDEEWPKCKKCDKWLPFFLQLNIDELPHEYCENYLTNYNKLKNHMIQLFYCINCGVDDADPYSGASLARIVPLNYKHRDERYLDPIIKNYIDFNSDYNIQQTEYTITEWIKEQPHGPSIGQLEEEREEEKKEKEEKEEEEEEEEEKDFCLRPSSRCLDDRFEMTDKSLGFDIERFMEENNPMEGDRLGGYPFWIIQGVYYLPCPKCKTVMDNLVFQHDGTLIAEDVFGDGGHGYIMLCKNCYDVVSFSWTCF